MGSWHWRGGHDPYGGEVRWTSRSWLWGLLAALLLGLVLMHHVPSHGGHDAESAAVSAAAAASGMAMTDGPAQCPCPAVDHNAPPPSGSGEPGTTALLHLCMAILAALGGMLAAGGMLRGTISRTVGSPGRRFGVAYLRPPVPVPRRLAALCVLRL